MRPAAVVPQAADATARMLATLGVTATGGMPLEALKPAACGGS